MILSVGYRVNSSNATYFRKWASAILKDYLLRGYAINPRLEQLEKRVAKTALAVSECCKNECVRFIQPPAGGPWRACLCKLGGVIRAKTSSPERRGCLRGQRPLY